MSTALLSLGSLVDLGMAGAMLLYAVTSCLWTVVTFLYWRMFDKAFVVSRKLEKAALDPNR